MRRYAYNVLIAVDQLANTLTGGWPDETFSARCWRLRGRGRGWAFMRRLVDLLFRPLEREHCRAAYESELWGLQQAPETRPERGEERKERE